MLKSKKILIFFSLIFLMIFIITADSFQRKKSFPEEMQKETSIKRPVLIVGDDINYPPYTYLDEEGNAVGFNIELSRAALDVMGYDVEFQLDQWSKTRISLENGKIDLISGMFYSEERAKIYSFSTKHSMTNGDIFTRKNISIKSIKDLKGQKVSVLKNGIIHEYLKSKELDIEFLEVPTVLDALTLVSEGICDYAGVLKVPAHYLIETKKIDNLHANGLYFTSEDYSMAVSRENEELLYIINGGLQILKATGAYQEIYDKWLGVYEEKSMIDVLKKHAWIFLSLSMLFIMLFILTVTLRQMVQAKTKALLLTNQELEAAMEELIATEDELRNQYNLLLKSEDELRKSQERNHALITALPDSLLIFNKEGRFLDCEVSDSCPFIEEPETFCGRLLKEVMPSQIADIGHEKIVETLKTEMLQTFDYSLFEGDEKQYYEARLVKSREDEVLAVVRDITDMHKNQTHIKYLSYHDQLTGLYNRRFFEEELKRLDTKENFPLCIIMADVNGLKLINDSFGHKTGDELLVKVSGVLKEACTQSQIISRIGGDEFVILAPNMDDRDAEKLVRFIEDLCTKEKVAAMTLSISFGWAAKDDISEDIDMIFNKAEDYMYKKKLFKRPSMRGKTINAIISTLHEKNEREAKHSKRVSVYCKVFAKVLNLSPNSVKEIQTMGLLHDIGKIAIDERLLNKPGKLTEEERAKIQKHPEIGYRILSAVNDMGDMGEKILAHHERWDGKGYPRGLKEEEIPIESRIIAIVDAFDAMTSERSYRKALSEEFALFELLKNAGTQFDPALVQVFVDKVIKEYAEDFDM